jgi:hypothetical protein
MFKLNKEDFNLGLVGVIHTLASSYKLFKCFKKMDLLKENG